MCVGGVVVKCPALPPCAADGCSRNPLYYYYVSGSQSFGRMKANRDLNNPEKETVSAKFVEDLVTHLGQVCFPLFQNL